MVYTEGMEGQEPLPVPASIAAAWGVRERPQKGPKPSLALDRIVQAGIALADAEGLPAVSMARVASELAVSTMSLYRYVAAKDELLLLMVDAALGPAPEPAGPDETWFEGLARWAWTYHDRVREHIWALRVPITGPPPTPNQVAWLESGLRSLGATGLAEDEKASVVLLLSGYVRSEATLAADLAAAEFTTDAAMQGYTRLLRALTDQEHFPALHTLLNAGVFDVADPTEKEFSFGLERILDGVGILIRDRQ
jgi:AcrR family transcriptional regulator